MSAHTFLGVAAVAAMITAPLVAHADADPTAGFAPPRDVAAHAKASPSWRVPEINLAFGLRTMVMPSAGLDPFATNDSVAQLSLAAGPTLLRRGAVSIAALAEWDYGNKEGMARTDATSLTMHRLGIGLETRLQLARRLMIFAKLSPAAVNLRGSITDAGIPRPLVARTWTWALDATAGLGVMFANTGPREAPTSRFWFTGELGYGFAGEATMTYAPESDAADPRKYGSIMLPALSPSGALGRLAVVVAF
jgi:hypothetical protein